MHRILWLEDHNCNSIEGHCSTPNMTYELFNFIKISLSNSNQNQKRAFIKLTTKRGEDSMEVEVKMKDLIHHLFYIMYHYLESLKRFDGIRVWCIRGAKCVSAKQRAYGTEEEGNILNGVVSLHLFV